MNEVYIYSIQIDQLLHKPKNQRITIQLNLWHTNSNNLTENNILLWRGQSFSCSLLFFLVSSLLLFFSILFLDVFESLQILLRQRERFGRKLFALKVKVGQSLFIWILFPTLKDYFSQLFGTFFSISIHFLQKRNIGIQNGLDFIKSYSLLRYVLFMSLDVLFVVWITLLFENLLMSQKGFDDRTKLCKVFFEVLIYSPIDLNLPVFLSIVNSFWLLRRHIALRIHGWHRLRYPISSRWYNCLKSSMKVWMAGVELVSEFFLTLRQFLGK